MRLNKKETMLTRNKLGDNNLVVQSHNAIEQQTGVISNQFDEQQVNKTVDYQDEIQENENEDQLNS